MCSAVIAKLRQLYEKNEAKVQEAMLAAHEDEEGDNKYKWKGIQNMGATCYISTILQVHALLINITTAILTIITINVRMFSFGSTFLRLGIAYCRLHP
jgi:ubiquitin C-terminal hydrolase